METKVKLKGVIRVVVEFAIVTLVVYLVGVFMTPLWACAALVFLCIAWTQIHPTAKAIVNPGARNALSFGAKHKFLCAVLACVLLLASYTGDKDWCGRSAARMQVKLPPNLRR